MQLMNSSTLPRVTNFSFSPAYHVMVCDWSMQAHGVPHPDFAQVPSLLWGWVRDEGIVAEGELSGN